MRSDHQEISDLKVRFVLTILTIFGTIVLAGTYQGNRLRGAPTTPAPRVTAITQITHDGFRKASLLADDSQLYVTELPASNRVIAKVQLAGSARSIISTPFSGPEALDLSPDRTKLLVSSTKVGSADDEFWMLPVAAGHAERVGDLTGRDATWSPNGTELAFAKGTTIYLSSADGKQTHELYKAPGSVFALRFSPDGHRIRFTVSDAEQGATSLWEVGRDGAHPRELLPDWPHKSAACCGSWTADSRYYIFQATQTVPNTSSVITTLWALSEDRATDKVVEPVPLTDGPMSFGNVSLSRDSKEIWAIGVQPNVEVVKFEPSKKRFVPVIPGLSATDVDFSANGKWIAYVSIPDGTLWRSRADGTDRLQLTPPGERAALPRWSPDGKQIAFVSMKSGESWKLYLLSADGGSPQPLVAENGSQIDANWSQDGSRLMFGDFAHDAGGLSIRILDFKTHKTEMVPGSQGLFSPRWSPNGRFIAALSPDNSALMLFDSQTQKWSKWTTSAGAVNYPVWSADSQYLYYDDFVNDAESIRRIKVGQNEAQRVFELGNLDRYLGALGPWSGRAADGSWMFVRDRSTQEVYQLTLELP